MTDKELLQLKMLMDIKRKVDRQTWLSDFSSNIAGNALWDGLVWVGRMLFKRL